MTHPCLHCAAPIPKRNKFCDVVCYGNHRKEQSVHVTPTRHCEHCGDRMIRHREPSGRIEGMGVFMRRRFCSKRCAAFARGHVTRARLKRTMRRKDLRTRWLLRRYVPISDAMGLPRPGNGAGAGEVCLEAAE